MINCGIIYFLFDGLKKIKFGYFFYCLYFFLFFWGLEKYFYELNFVEEIICVYSMLYYKIKCCMYFSFEYVIEML